MRTHTTEPGIDHTTRWEITTRWLRLWWWTTCAQWGVSRAESQPWVCFNLGRLMLHIRYPLPYKGAYRAHRGDRRFTLLLRTGVCLKWRGKLHVWTWV